MIWDYCVPDFLCSFICFSYFMKDIIGKNITSSFKRLLEQLIKRLAYKASYKLICGLPNMTYLKRSKNKLPYKLTVVRQTHPLYTLPHSYHTKLPTLTSLNFKPLSKLPQYLYDLPMQQSNLVAINFGRKIISKRNILIHNISIMKYILLLEHLSKIILGYHNLCLPHEIISLGIIRISHYGHFFI